MQQWGRIDTLVCNAAVNPYFGPLANIPDEAFDKIMSSNIKSNLWLCNLAIPSMAEKGGGSVVIVSSIGGLRGSAMLGAYGISKAADFQLARSLAVEWGPKNVRVNCVAPGLVKTDFARALWEDEKNLKPRLATTPLRRIGEPDEIGGIVAFLASRCGVLHHRHRHRRRRRRYDRVRAAAGVAACVRWAPRREPSPLRHDGAVAAYTPVSPHHVRCGNIQSLWTDLPYSTF